MKTILKIIFYSLIIFVISSCSKNKENEIPQPSPIDISEKILGEWVYDNPVDGSWQSMKFTGSGAFYYSENKEEWTAALKRTDGKYSLDGYNVSGYRANGTLYVDMTIQNINDYSFTTRYKNTAIDFTYHKVLMRTHLNFAESIIPPYEKLIDKNVISYKSHDEKIATVDSNTGEITATGTNGRTYIDITTNDGTACIKVMVGNVNDGDETETSTIPAQKDPVSISTTDVRKMIIGVLWIYDHPEEKIWEAIRFTESGKVYYSNKNDDWNFENENTNGSFEINQKTITGSVKLYGTTTMDFYWVVTNISDFEFTVKVYTSGVYVGKFTYSKQLDTIEMNVGDSSKPDYQKLIGDKTIKEFKSHNTSCVSINNDTGEITAKGEGHTYIDVVTEDGTAVIEVNVSKGKYFIAYDYSQFIGVTKQTVTETFGTIFESGTNSITYNYLKGSEAQISGMVKDKNWKAITFEFDPTTQLVVSIGMQANDDVWFTNIEMTNYLSELYYKYEKGTTDTYKAFINAEKFDDATVGIAWNYEDRTLVFVKTRYQPGQSATIADYSVYIGKNQNEIIEMMGKEPMTISKERIVYDIKSTYVNDVYFEFESRAGSTKVLKDVVQQVTVHLTSDANEDIVKNVVEKSFKYESGIANSFSNYISNDGKIKLYYNISWKTLTYSLVES